MHKQAKTKGYLKGEETVPLSNLNKLYF